MKTITSIFCAILLLQSSFAASNVKETNVETRSLLDDVVKSPYDTNLPNELSNLIDEATEDSEKAVDNSIDNLRGVYSNVFSEVHQQLGELEASLATEVTEQYPQVKEISDTLSKLENSLIEWENELGENVTQISSNTDTIFENVKKDLLNIVKDVVSTLNPLNVIYKTKAIQTLMKLIPVAQAGLSGLVNCTKDFVKTNSDQVNHLQQIVNEAVSLLKNDIQCFGKSSVIGETSEDIKKCVIEAIITTTSLGGKVTNLKKEIKGAGNFAQCVSKFYISIDHYVNQIP